jgi:hypothetical protein
MRGKGLLAALEARWLFELFVKPSADVRYLRNPAAPAEMPACPLKLSPNPAWRDTPLLFDIGANCRAACGDGQITPPAPPPDTTPYKPRALALC